MFAAVAKKVIIAASRVLLSLSALARLPAIVLKSARPASVLINVAGKAANKAASVTPKIPTKI